MFKFFKKISSILVKLDRMLETLEEIKRRSGVVESTGQFVPITSNELGQIWKNYSHTIYVKEKENMRKYRGNLTDCLYQYDRLLYMSTQFMSSNDPMIILNIMYQLTALKEYIYEILFDTTEVESFYLYFLDTETLRAFVSEIPLIDLDKVFMVGYDHEPPKEERHVKVSMTRSQFVISTSDSSYEIALKLRKSVLRTLYSLYTRKYHLYHLSDNDISPMDVEKI